MNVLSLLLQTIYCHQERKIGLPDFSRFRRSETGGADSGFGNAFDGQRNDGYGNGYDGQMDGGFGDGFDGQMDGGFGDGFDDDADIGFFDDAFEDYANGNDDAQMYFDDSGSSSDPCSGQSGKEADAASDKKGRGDKVGLKSAVTALFQAVTGRFQGREKPAVDSGVDSSDASFANDFDSAVDDGYVSEQNLSGEANGDGREAAPAHGGQTGRYDEDDFRGMGDDGRSEKESDGSGYADRDYRSGDYPEARYHAPESLSDMPSEDHYDDAGSSSRDDNDGRADARRVEAPPVPEETSGELLAAVASSLRRFRRRLPSFRPKVYVVPEPEYTPEDDGIGTPTLASDIQRILEEQNKPGETEQEYDRMRSYIQTVSTDARIRPGDIKAPENIGEVRAAESELSGLIDSMIHTNEQQRRRIGVYEMPPEEDPYNYRGINNDRQFYSDMEAFSFDMNPRYGFVSEEKIDPGRKYAEMEYYGDLNGEQTRQDAMNAAYGDNGQFADDGFNDDFGDYLNRADAGDGLIDAASGEAGAYYRSPGSGSPEDSGLEDDFGDDPGAAGGGGYGTADYGADLGDIDEPDGGNYQPHPKRGSRFSGRSYENPDANALYDEGFVDYRTKRSGERRNFIRRGGR